MSLINNPSLRLLYQQAGDRRRWEAATARLWMALFTGMLPASRQVYIVQEQPPANITRRRVDAKVYCFVNNVQRDLLYVEFKRASFPGGRRAEAEES